MTARTPTYLKGRYEQGDIPQGTDYEDVFDSYVNVALTSEQSISGNLRTSGELIASRVSAGTIFQNTVSALAVYSDTGSIGVVSANSANIITLISNDITASAMHTDSLSANIVSTSALRTTTVSADSINVSGNVVYGSFDISALATTQAATLTINGTTNFVIFADGNNNAVKLPSSQRGRVQYVINASTTVIKLFPATSGRFLVTAVNASLNIPADKCAMVFHKGDDRYGMMVG